MPTSSPPWFMPPSAIRPVPPSDHDRCRRGRPPEALLLGKREVPDLFAPPSVSHSVVGLRVTQIEIATSERARSMGREMDTREGARAPLAMCFHFPQWRKRGRRRVAAASVVGRRINPFPPSVRPPVPPSLRPDSIHHREARTWRLEVSRWNGKSKRFKSHDRMRNLLLHIDN